MRFDLSIDLPSWLREYTLPRSLNTIDERMALVLDLAEENIRNNSGGPFAAAIFHEKSGRLLSVATNRVVPCHCSVAHAEILAISLAQQTLGTHSLHNDPWQLVSSAEPCAMCTGAIGWSGLSSLVYGAVKKDVEKIGFEEGHKPADWAEALNQAGTRVDSPVMQKRASEVLQLYRQQQGMIYNPGSQG